MQSVKATTRSPIISRVFFGLNSARSIGNPSILEQDLGEPPSRCQFMRYEVIPANEVGGYKVSKPFLLTPGKVQPMTSQNDATYRLKIPVRVGVKGKVFTQSPSNHLCLAAAKGNHIEVWGFGLIVFEGRLLKIKHKKFDTMVYKNGGELIMPEVSNNEGLAKMLSKLVDESKLSDWDNPSVREATILPTKGQGIVKWVDPFSQRMALDTAEGSAFSLFRHVDNLKFDGTKIILPKPGDIVEVLQLQAPEKDSKTTFDKVATRVKLLS